MTITFGEEVGRTIGFRISCYCTQKSAPLLEFPYPQVEQKLIEVKKRLDNDIPLDGCKDPEDCCLRTGVFARAEFENEMPSDMRIKLSNDKAFLMLDLLGMIKNYDPLTVNYDAGFAASVNADDMTARIDLALALTPIDQGVPPVQDGWMISCGRPAGFAHETLMSFRKIAEWCKENDRKVSIA